MCIINPRVDFAFKKLFGSEENKDLLMSLINAIVSEDGRVADIELKKSLQPGRLSSRQDLDPRHQGEERKRPQVQHRDAN